MAKLRKHAHCVLQTSPQYDWTWSSPSDGLTMLPRIFLRTGSLYKLISLIGKLSWQACVSKKWNRGHCLESHPSALFPAAGLAAPHGKPRTTIQAMLNTPVSFPDCELPRLRLLPLTTRAVCSYLVPTHLSAFTSLLNSFRVSHPFSQHSLCSLPHRKIAQFVIKYLVSVPLSSL